MTVLAPAAVGLGVLLRTHNGWFAEAIAAPLSWDPPAIQDFPDHEALVRSPSSGVDAGRRLFRAKFNRADGAGRPAATGDSKPTLRSSRDDFAFIRTSGPDANSCFGCHNDPVEGGSGDFAVNVFVGAHFKDPPSTTIVTSVTSERNTITTFGSGAIEMLSREMTHDLKMQQQRALAAAREQGRDLETPLVAKEVSFGVIVARPDGTFDASRLEGVDPDLVIKPFGAKGVVISLREFAINALNHHHGMQAVERFGWERTGLRDFDQDGIEVEVAIGQVSALALFQASRPAPSRRQPRDRSEADAVDRGSKVFSEMGCASCHRPEMPIEAAVFTEPNPYNRPGNLTPEDVDSMIRLPLPTGGPRSGLRKSHDGHVLVAAYTDLKRHRICDSDDQFFCNEQLRQDNVPTDQFLTSKLWDLATSGPYGHRGDCTTVSEAILHHSGEAAQSRRAFTQLPETDKSAVVAFLLNLGADTNTYNTTLRGATNEP